MGGDECDYSVLLRSVARRVKHFHDINFSIVTNLINNICSNVLCLLNCACNLYLNVGPWHTWSMWKGVQTNITSFEGTVALD